MKTLLLFTILFAGCVSGKQHKLTSPTWQDGFIPNIELDTLNSIMLLPSKQHKCDCHPRLYLRESICPIGTAPIIMTMPISMTLSDSGKILDKQ